MIKPEQISAVIEFLKGEELSEAAVAKLREEFDGLHFTYCMDDEMGDAAVFQECEGYNLYLVDSANHCSVLTRDPESASGLVLAEVIDDDG